MDELLTAKDLTKIFKCSIGYVYKLSERGQIPSIRIPCSTLGTKKKELVRFKREDVEKFINDHYKK